MCQKKIYSKLVRYANLYRQKMMIFTKDNIIYGYRAHVLCSSMMMHYGAIMRYVIRFLNNA
jgi:hypothetical protein